MKTKIFLTLLLVTATLMTANAQLLQKKRIREGVKSGEITRAESAKLRHEQRNFRKQKAIAKADGVITPREKARLRNEKRQNSREIFRKKHNARDRRF